MKIEIIKEHLETVLNIVSRVSNKNLSLPVLGCVVFFAEKGRVVVRATNLDVSIEAELKAKIFSEGVVAVPASIITHITSAATSTKIILEKKESFLQFIADKNTAKIKVVESADFPTLPFVREGEGMSAVFSGKEFSRVLKLVSFASSTSGMRPELSSIFLSLEGGVLTGAATDSFRLAEMRLPIKQKASFDPVLIPQRNISDILRLVGDADTIEVRRSDAQMTVLVQGSYITSRVIEGAFPDYQAIIPHTFETTVTVLSDDLRRALKRVSVFTENTNRVTVEVIPGEKKLTLFTENTQVGETIESIDAVIEGAPMKITFNVKYILDALQVISADSIKLEIVGSGKPMVMKEVPESGFLYLVMPMNV